MNIQSLKKEQIKLAKKVIVKDDFDSSEFIGGCSQAVLGDNIISCITVLNRESLEVVEKKYAVAPAPINYIPGFLSYRESPAVVEAFSKLDKKPDILIVDGNGILHPRRIGLASHIGILTDVPTIGIAKSLVIGSVENGKIVVDGEVRGIELMTKEHAKPIYVSPGHRVNIRTSEKIVREMLIEKHKMPEPLHEAHKYAKKIRKKLEVKGED